MKVFCLSLLTVALLAGSATSFASQSTNIGKGTKRCVPEPGADCRGVVERWTVEYHGDLRKAKFTGAVLHGADFRGADLRGADFRGAKLKGARFDKVKQTGKNTKQGNTSCVYLQQNCPFADLSYANFTGAYLGNVSFLYANLSYANFTNATLLEGVNFMYANLSYANFTSADVYSAKMDYANMTGVTLTGSAWGGSYGCFTVTPSGYLNGYC